MKKSLYISEQRAGFSLVEVLAAMMIGTMILIAVFSVYDRAVKAAASVNSHLDKSKRPYEVLQLIAEDLDKMISNDGDTNVIAINRYIDKKYRAALLVYRLRYKDATNKEQTYKEYIWQCNVDPEGDPNNMILYRAYEGLEKEDKLLDKDKDKSEMDVYVPICDGVTYFSVEIHSGKEEPDVTWASGVPYGITITISFAEPFVDEDGFFDVLESEKYSRTIAFDKSRKINFDISQEDSDDTDSSS